MKTLADYKEAIEPLLGHSTPLTAEFVCKMLGIHKRRGGYSPREFERYTMVGRALQALKHDGLAVYLTKADGGPGWRHT